MSNKKKIVIICSMVVLLVAAAYLNVLITKKNTQTAAKTIGDEDSTVVSFFTSYRSARDASRQESFMYYDSIINSETASVAAIASAEDFTRGAAPWRHSAKPFGLNLIVICVIPATSQHLAAHG